MKRTRPMRRTRKSITTGTVKQATIKKLRSYLWEENAGRTSGTKDGEGSFVSLTFVRIYKIWGEVGKPRRDLIGSRFRCFDQASSTQRPFAIFPDLGFFFSISLDLSLRTSLNSLGSPSLRFFNQLSLVFNLLFFTFITSPPPPPPQHSLYSLAFRRQSTLFYLPRL